MKKILLFSLVFGLVLFTTGCGLTDKLADEATKKVTEKALESVTNSDIDLTNNKITVNSNGESFSLGEDLVLPDKFPADVPIYSKAKIITTSTSGTAGFYATLTSSDSFTEVNEYYNAELAAQGWTIDNTSTFTGGGQSTTYITSKTGRTLDIGVYKYEGANEVTISITTDTPDASN